MFERYTEKARRVIFFARYEASQYGSPYIETEHLLLGLLREDHAFARTLLRQAAVLQQVRAEIERVIVPKERISTSVQVPLSDDSRRVLSLAEEESARLGHQHIGTEHILLGILGLEQSLEAQLLAARGVKADEVRSKLAEIRKPVGNSAKDRRDAEAAEAKLALDSFLAALKCSKSADLGEAFAPNARFVDVFGKRWNHDEISESFATLFAPYAKKNAAPVVEEILADEYGFFIASVLWKNAVLASIERIWMHRMSFVLTREDDGWRILLLQVTALQPSQD